MQKSTINICVCALISDALHCLTVLLHCFLFTKQITALQNFARAFDVFFQTKDETRELVWATSWGVSTRLMGALVMTHADDAGLRYIYTQ
jgi:prolyl-tRNA synthetase